MPELPEAETIKRVIEPQIQGLMIKNVIVNRPEVIAYPHAGEFCKQLVGQTISGMARRGKFLLILLDSGDRVIIHLRMTGCLLLTPADYRKKSTHILYFAYRMKKSCVFPTYGVSDVFGCFKMVKQMPTAVWIGWGWSRLTLPFLLNI